MENQVDKQYQALLQDILDNGIEKKDRTGTGTLSIFGRQLRFNDIEHNFPILTTKKMPLKSIVTELLWFLRGDTNIQYLVQNGCNIWNGDAYKNYTTKLLEKHSKHYEPMGMKEFIERIKTDDAFANEYGELGPIYGKQWREWGGKKTISVNLENVKPSKWERVMDMVKNGEDVSEYGVIIETKNNSVDQIQNLINELKTNPNSRRLMVSAWNVGELDQMVLPPCHYGFQLYTRELSVEERLDLASKTYKELFEPFDFHKCDHAEIDELYPVPKRAISLMWNQRSVDTFLGLPFNITSYALLLRIIAKEVNMIADELIANLGDTHLYSNHIEQTKEQIARESFELPTLKISEHVKRAEGDCLPMYKLDDFTLENYQSHQTIKASLSN
jgi:thymidylate synthase